MFSVGVSYTTLAGHTYAHVVRYDRDELLGVTCQTQLLDIAAVAAQQALQAVTAAIRKDNPAPQDPHAPDNNPNNNGD